MSTASRSSGSPQRLIRVGLLVESLSDRFWHEIVLSVDAAARRRGVKLFVFIGGTLDAPDIAARQANRCYQLASTESVDGLIVAPLGSSAGPERLAQYFARYRPLPMSALTGVFADVPSVCTDNVRSIEQAVSHLIEVHAARRIAFIRGPRLNAEAELRLQGYRQALANHGLSEDENLVLQGDFSEASGGRVIRELDIDGSAPFEALVAANDSMALGALAELEGRGVRVPEQLLVVSFDDVPEGRWGKPSLTTVRQSLAHLAETALDRVLSQLAGEAASPLTLIPGELVIRESCGCRSVFDSVSASTRPPGTELALEARLTAALEGLHPSTSDQLERDWRGELARALGADYRTSTAHRFPAALAEMLCRVAPAGRELGDWQRVVSSLRSALMPNERPAREGQLLSSRIQVADFAERQQAALRIRSETMLRETIAAGSDVLGSFSEQGLFSALTQHLPSLELGCCLMSLYEAGSPWPPEQSRLVFAYRDGARLELPASGIPFTTRELAPAMLLPDRPITVTIAPLFFADNPIGTLMFELGPPQGQVYDWLREQVSVALEGARLIRRVGEEVAERERAERQRLAQELKLAARIQASVLPQSVEVEGLDIAARMVPATEVGGDCYDILACPRGAWLTVGDVAGHGLGPGVVMMMLQSSVAALLRAHPAASPAEVLAVVNAVMFENVKQRLGQDEHATLLLMRYASDGSLVFAGAHEEPIVYRARTGRTEILPAPGLWVGVKPDVTGHMPESHARLEAGDVLLLYTDGAVEARNARRQQYGVARLASELESVHSEPVDRIRDHLFQSIVRWMDAQRDDITLVVARQRG